MSLSIFLTAKVDTDVVAKNITHNLTGMWKEAGVFDALYESEGKTAEEVLPELEAGLALMIQDPERFEKFNASNGWGTYKHAVPFLSELIAGFKKYPNGVIKVSR